MGKDFKDLLKEWRVPDPPPQLDARVAATYSRLRRRGLSRWTGPVRLPAPVFALLLVLQLVSGGVIFHGLLNPAIPNLTPPERIVEVPVFREKVVTRLVYVPLPDTDTLGRRALYSSPEHESEKPPMDLTGFRPVTQFQIHVIKGEYRNER